eukprot:GHVU01061323.1.p1 GENE.GHVU01061323.1~~GHVU01061323.1.p1  ORF type:complete len:603 (+),score=23.35 GHVU01061323.1:189-1811(+)
MSQTRHHYGTLRKVRRITLPNKYPTAPPGSTASTVVPPGGGTGSVSGGLAGGYPSALPAGTVLKSGGLPPGISGGLPPRISGGLPPGISGGLPPGLSGGLPPTLLPPGPIGSSFLSSGAGGSTSAFSFPSAASAYGLPPPLPPPSTVTTASGVSSASSSSSSLIRKHSSSSHYGNPSKRVTRSRLSTLAPIPPSTGSSSTSTSTSTGGFGAMGFSGMPPGFSHLPFGLGVGSSGLHTHPVTHAMSGITGVLTSAALPGVMSMPLAHPAPPYHTPVPSRNPARPVTVISNKPDRGRRPSRPGRSKDDSADHVLRRFVSKVDKPPKDEDCCICCESLQSSSGYGEDGSVPLVDRQTVYKLCNCKHMFHKPCLSAMYNSGTKDGSLQCPTCKAIYGEKMGNCPPGTMQYTVYNQQLPGETCDTIRITYDIQGGIQGDGHPQPGRPYTTRGFPRICYLPDSPKGNKVLRLLIKAWERRLTFTIGTSVTTGEADTVVWNEIHHKTESRSNASGHGYPDPNYIENVLLELSIQGVTEEDEEEDMQQ